MISSTSTTNRFFIVYYIRIYTGENGMFTEFIDGVTGRVAGIVGSRELVQDSMVQDLAVHRCSLYCRPFCLFTNIGLEHDWFVAPEPVSFPFAGHDDDHGFIHPFADNGDLASLIMSFCAPKDMRAAASINKLFFKSLLLYDVIHNCLHSGGSSYKSMTRLHSLFAEKSIFPMTAFRLLSICTGTVCEYCRKATNLNLSKPGKTCTVRQSFGVLACFKCLSNTDGVITRQFGSDGSHYYSLTAKFSKLRWSTQHCRNFHNQYYLAHRYALYQIFEYHRVRSHPYGVRFFDLEDEPSTHDVGSESSDRYEVLWATAQTDSFGQPTGPVFVRSYLENLVSYLEEPDNQGIDHYFEHMIPGMPKSNEYDLIIEAFDRALPGSWQKNRENQILLRSIREVRQYNKIECAVQAMAMVALQMSATNLRKWRLEFMGRTRPTIPYDQQSLIMRRLVLLYREIPYPYAKWCITFDTGLLSMDRQLHYCLGFFIRSPRMLKTDEARTMAQLVFRECSSHVFLMDVPGVYLLPNVAAEDNGWLVRTTFGPGYRRQYRASSIPRYPEWTDRSMNRCV